MMNVRRSLAGDERGAVLVQVAIAILVMTAMATFVVDHGVLWVSRGQAQNAADAGALSGAIARAYDELTDPPASNGKAFNSAMGAALANSVWTAAPTVQVSWACPPWVAGSCVRVDVYRNGEFGSTPLPTIFGKLLNISSHGVRATATARASNGNATSHLRPFAVIDRWWELRTPANTDFDRWDSRGDELPGTVDWYQPPEAGLTGSGYRVPLDVGRQVILKTGNNPDSSSALSGVVSGWTLPLRLPDGAGGYASGASEYNSAIKHGTGNPVSIGQYLPTENGTMVGPTNQGVERDSDSLINQDPNARWDASTNTVTDSCAPACGSFSPRIVPIAVFDFDEFVWRHEANNWTTEWIPGTAGAPGHPGNRAFSCPIGGKCVRVTNLIGFFVESMSGSDVTGRVVMYPGEFVPAAPNLGSASSFLHVIQLVR